MAKKKGANTLGGAVMSLFLDKRARETLKAAKGAQPVGEQPATPQAPQAPQATAAPTAPHPTREEINARLDEAVERRAQRANTPDRQALIEDALRIHADKSKILDDLPEEQKQKLKAMAMMALLKPGSGG